MKVTASSLTLTCHREGSLSSGQDRKELSHRDASSQGYRANLNLVVTEVHSSCDSGKEDYRFCTPLLRSSFSTASSS
jgi:hypothetical protein